MNRRVVLGVSLLAIVLCTTTVFAQAEKGQKGPRGRQGGQMMGMRGGGMGNLIGLLRNEAVREELKIKEDQQAKLQELATSMRGAGQGLQGLRDLSDDERRAKMAEMRETMQKQAAELKEKVAKILDKEQMTRLEQIQIQAAGPMSLLMGKTAEKLGVTEEQRTKAREAMRDAFGGGGGQGDRAAAMAKMQETIMGLMTADQKAKYKEMTGKPFDVSKLRGQGGRQGQGRPGARKRGPDA